MTPRSGNPPAWTASSALRRPAAHLTRAESAPRALTAGVRAPEIAAVALVLAGCLIVAHEARRLTFTDDDWAFILGRRGHSLGVFLRPHNEHLSALPILAYKVLLRVFGAGSYTPFMALLLVTHGIACLLLYALARRRVGPWAALAPAAVLVVLGPAWHDLLWAFQVGFVGSVAAGLAMVLCLERRDRRGDIAASVLLATSLLCSSVGLGMLVLGAVLLGLETPRRLRRLWVVGIPLALYGAWYAVYGVSDVTHGRIVHLPGYLADALSAALASVTGLAQTHASPYFVSLNYGRFIAAAAVGLLILHLVRGGRVPALAWAALAAAVALWTAACLSGALGGAFREANQSRYQYASAALVLLAAVSLAQGWRPTGRSGVVLAALTLLACGSNLSMLRQRAGWWTVNSEYSAAGTGAMEVARQGIAPNFMPEDLFTGATIGNYSLLYVAARPYFSAVAAYGSAADSPQRILRRPEKVREAADLILAHAERLRLRPVGGLRVQGAACRSAPTGSALGQITLVAGTLAARIGPGPPARLELRRFASGFRFVVFALKPGTTGTLTLPRDRASIPWRVRLVGGRRVRVCAAPPA
jgi:hypothetical protein